MKVFLATPAYDGTVLEQFQDSLTSTMQFLSKEGIPVEWKTLAGCCYLPLARNKLVRQFLESDATDLIFLDGDIEWEPDAIMRLLSWPVDIVGGAYCVKEYEERYPVWLKQQASGAPVRGGLSELIECWGIPTGFMRITRSVFDAMQQHYGEELEIDEYGPGTFEKTGMFLNFFDTEKRGRQWFGEDTNFCWKWTQQMGRQLWVDPLIKLTHWGTWPSGHPRGFKSDFHDYLARLPGGARDPGYQGTNIPGFLTKKEAQWLYLQATAMNSVVELGSFAGKSAHAILSGCKGPVTCVDTWKPLDWHDAGKSLGLPDDYKLAEERFVSFLDHTAQFPNRIVKRMRSMDAVKDFADKSVDMVWIDADHSYQSVSEDIQAWLPKARKLICGHDYEEWGWPAVKRAVDEIFGERMRTMGAIWYVDLEDEG